MLAIASLADSASAGRNLVRDTAPYLHTRGDVFGSLSVSQQVLDRWRASLGSTIPTPSPSPHPHQARTLTLALVAAAETGPACALGKDTSPRCRQVLGQDHPLTLWAAAFLASALTSVGKVQSARMLDEDTLQRSRRLFGPHHPITLYLTQVAGIGGRQKAPTRGPAPGTSPRAP